MDNILDHLSYFWLLHKRCSHYASGKQMSSAVANSRLTCNKHAVSFAITVFAIIIIIIVTIMNTTTTCDCCHGDGIYDGRYSNPKQLTRPRASLRSPKLLQSSNHCVVRGPQGEKKHKWKKTGKPKDDRPKI